jgi:phenylacetate-CoA ligase
MTRQFTPENIISVQSEKLRRLVRYCFDVKYYRELFANVGIKPEDITSVQDLPKIPFLTKEELRGRFWDFLPRQLPSCRVSRTSGSTGIPVCILSDRNSRMFNSAAVIRYRQALGIGLIGRPILTPLKTENDPHREAHWTFLQGIHKTHYINPYLNSNKNVEYAARLLKKLKKPAIVGIGRPHQRRNSHSEGPPPARIHIRRHSHRCLQLQRGRRRRLAMPPRCRLSHKCRQRNSGSRQG